MDKQAILEASDLGYRVADIAEKFGTSASVVYTLLREHRPNRKNSRRIGMNSDRPYVIKGLLRDGVAPGRIAKLLNVTRQYVNRIQNDPWNPLRD